MKIAIDAVGIRGHGGAAVLVELLHWLPIVRPDWDWHVFLFERRLREFDDPKVSEKVTLEHVGLGNSGWQRLKWVNRYLPERVRGLGADVLFSFANIAPAKAIVPQVVFCHQLNAFFREGISPRMFVQRARFRFMRRQILRGARASRAVIVQTNAMRQRIEEIEPKLRGHIHVVPSGYRTPSGRPTIREEVRQAVESAPHPRLIYVSHPGRHKNHLTLVRALSIIVRHEPSARLLLTLDRTRPGDSYYNRLTYEIQVESERQGVAGHILWLGRLTPDEVDFALKSADMMVFPSLSESFGLGLVEAMAAGCPLAASDLSYAHDVAGAAAIYFDPQDPQAMAATILNALNSQGELERMRTMGKNMIERFSYDKIAEEIAQILGAAARSYGGVLHA